MGLVWSVFAYSCLGPIEIADPIVLCLCLVMSRIKWAKGDRGGDSFLNLIKSKMD